MARWVNISTMRGANHPNDIRRGRMRMLEIWEMLMDRAFLDRPDILLLPECFMGLDGPYEPTFNGQASDETPVQSFLSRKAKEYNSYIAAGIKRTDKAGNKYNSAIVFDRAGEVTGIYDKIFPTPGEMKCGVVPGFEPLVFDLDFGRIGIALCFDLNFPELFDDYRRQKVDLCCFLSSMHGGAHLPALARNNRMYIASSVEWGWSYIINPIGEILAKTMDNQRMVSHRINLDVEMLHLSPPEFPFDLKRKYGKTVRLLAAEAEPWKLLVCDRDDLTAADVLREFKVERLDETLEVTRQMRQARVPDGFTGKH